MTELEETKRRLNKVIVDYGLWTEEGDWEAEWEKADIAETQARLGFSDEELLAYALDSLPAAKLYLLAASQVSINFEDLVINIVDLNKPKT